MTPRERPNRKYFRGPCSRRAVTSLCLGWFPVTPAGRAVKPEAGSHPVACRVSGAALLSALHRWLYGGKVRTALSTQPSALGRDMENPRVADLRKSHASGMGGGKGSEILAPAPHGMANENSRQRSKYSHQVWTTADGFTLSGARRA